VQIVTISVKRGMKLKKQSDKYLKRNQRTQLKSNSQYKKVNMAPRIAPTKCKLATKNSTQNLPNTNTFSLKTFTPANSSTSSTAINITISEFEARNEVAAPL
jgi:hypothetical protein